MQYASLEVNFSTSDHATIADEYRTACCWFEQFGFDLARTRLSKYRGIVYELAHHQQLGTLATASFRHTFPEQANAYGEVSEILRIHRGLASLYDSALRDRLEKVLSGKDGRPNPSEFDPARDTAFELLMASRLHAAGFAIDFANDADLYITIAGNELFVECKRLKSELCVSNRIKKGLKQLRRRYDKACDTECARGLLALSLSDLENPHHQLIVSQTPQMMNDFASNINRRFVRDYECIWHEESDKRTIGVLVEFSAVGVIQKPHMLTTCTEIGVNNCCPVQSAEWTLLSKLIKEMALVKI